MLTLLSGLTVVVLVVAVARWSIDELPVGVREIDSGRAHPLERSPVMFKKRLTV